MWSTPTKFFSRRSGVVAACTMGTFVNPTPTVNTVFGLFLIPISTEFGWTRSSVSAVLLIVAVTSSLSYPVIGRLADRHGVRPIVLMGNILFAGSMALVAFVQVSHLQLYFVYVLIGIPDTTDKTQKEPSIIIEPAGNHFCHENWSKCGAGNPNEHIDEIEL